jgi:hypothetical protein
MAMQLHGRAGWNHVEGAKVYLCIRMVLVWYYMSNLPVSMHLPAPD